MGGVHFAEGDLRVETKVLNRLLEVLPGGDFREVETTARTFIFSPDAAFRLSGIRSPDAARVEQAPERKASLGIWRSFGDSVFFERDPDVLAGELVVSLEGLDPSTDLDSLRAGITRMLRGALRVSDRSSDKIVSYRGTWTDHRLTLVDVNGKALVFRR